jgi:hypothetical protein
MDTYAFSVLEVMSAKEITHRFHAEIQLIRNAMHASRGQRIFDFTKFVKGYCSVHSSHN